MTLHLHKEETRELLQVGSQHLTVTCRPVVGEALGSGAAVLRDSTEPLPGIRVLEGFQIPCQLP